MVHRQMAGQLAVSLFRPRGVKVAGTQARLYMPYRDTLIKCRQAGGQRGGGIAMNQHHIRFEFLKNAFQAFKDAAGDLT
ncbi:hypothetical protein D3C72_1610200 [compost metagenome]